MSANDTQAPPQPAATTVDVVMAAQLDAAKVTATKAAGATSAAEAKDFAQASLLLSQATTILDPARLQGGDTPQARKDSIPPQQPPAVRDTDRDGKVGEQ